MIVLTFMLLLINDYKNKQDIEGIKSLVGSELNFQVEGGHCFCKQVIH